MNEVGPHSFRASRTSQDLFAGLGVIRARSRTTSIPEPELPCVRGSTGIYVGSFERFAFGMTDPFGRYSPNFFEGYVTVPVPKALPHAGRHCLSDVPDRPGMTMRDDDRYGSHPSMLLRFNVNVFMKVIRRARRNLPILRRGRACSLDLRRVPGSPKAR